MAEIKENDYNLNIPRHVDTFEEEEEIDIQAVAKELQELKKEEADLQKAVTKFCKELNINTPF